MPDAPTNAPAPSGRPSGTGAGVGRPRIIDTPEVRVHHPVDLVGSVVAMLAALVVLALAAYAHNTTSGVAEDVEGVASLLQDLLVVPVRLLERLVTYAIPVAVVVELAIRRLVRPIIEGAAASMVSLLACSGVNWLITHFGSDQLVAGLSVWLDGRWTITIPNFLALISGLLVAVGPRGRRRSVRWSWNLVWVALGIMVITGEVSITGVGVALLIGRAGGQITRYVSGVRSERAYGSSLVAGIRRAGFRPVLLERISNTIPQEDSPGPVCAPGTPASRAVARYSDHRIYAMTTDAGTQYDVVVYDGDRQMIGFLTRLWRSVQLRGLDGRSTASLRQAAERSALLSYTAFAAGVHSPRLHSMAEADASMVLVQDQIKQAVPLAELTADDIDDDVLREVWAQLGTAHEAGLAHRALTSDVVLLGRRDDGAPAVWITGWEQGDVASSELAQRMDRTQMVALLALRVGSDRALESAVAVLPASDIEAIGPLLQPVALPRRTREELRENKAVLKQLRSALVDRLPKADVEPQALNRFSPRALLTVLLTVAAVIILLTTINIRTILEALSETDWRLSVLAFALSMCTLVGSALALVAFAPEKIPLWRATVTQSAATFVALAAPAGIGPAALNLRLLTRRGASTALATATVALVQVSQLVVTVLLLLGLSVASGTNQLERFAVSSAVVIAIVVVLAMLASLMLVPKIRVWVMGKTLPILRQTWPRLVEVVGQPSRLLLGIGGNVLTTLGYVLAFEVCLRAFGVNLSVIQVAIVFLVGNTAGSLAPTPGGVGTTEIALAGALSLVGVNPGVAMSVAVLFRVLTYWLRIPVGWLSMRYLRKVGEL